MFEYSRQFITQLLRHRVNWPRNWALMKPTKAVPLVKGWVFEGEKLFFVIYFSFFQILQYDMWGVTPTDLWDWSSLKEKIAQ